MKRIVISVLVIILMITSLGCEVKFHSTALEGVDENSTIESNSGIAANVGEWVYFINGAVPTIMEEPDNHVVWGALCRAKQDGTQVQVVVPRRVYKFHIYKDTIYFIATGRTTLEVCKININGLDYSKLSNMDDKGWYGFCDSGIAFTKGGKTVLLDYESENQTVMVDRKVSQLFQIGQYLIYSDISPLGSIRLFKVAINDPLNEVQIRQSYNLICGIDGDYVYFVDASNNYLHRVNIQTHESEQLSNSEYTWGTIVPGKNTAVLWNNHKTDQVGLYTLPIDEGAIRTKVADTLVYNVIVDQDVIYYVEKETNNLYRVNLDGSDKRLLSTYPVMDSEAFKLDSCGEYIYFFINEAEHASIGRAKKDGSGFSEIRYKK